MWHSPPVELSSGQPKGAASYDSPIICVSCFIDRYSLVLSLMLSELFLAASLPPLYLDYVEVITSIDEWNQFFGSLFILLIRILEFFCQQFFLKPDPVKDNRDEE